MGGNWDDTCKVLQSRNFSTERPQIHSCFVTVCVCESIWTSCLRVCVFCRSEISVQSNSFSCATWKLTSKRLTSESALFRRWSTCSPCTHSLCHTHKLQYTVCIHTLIKTVTCYCEHQQPTVLAWGRGLQPVALLPLCIDSKHNDKWYIWYN